jgi:cytochrome b561
MNAIKRGGMRFKNNTLDYGLIARLLHWLSVTLLLSVLYLAGQIELEGEVIQRLALIDQHSLIGFGLLALMLLRFSWRQVNVNPVKSYSLHPLQKMAAITLHRGIYALIIVQCLLGGYLWFCKPGDLSTAVLAHDVMNDLVYIILFIHISAALYHQVFGVVSSKP